MNDFCGQDFCGVCSRRDMDVWSDQEVMVNYVGDYAIFTAVALERSSAIVEMAFNLLGRQAPPRYITTVAYVGDASLRDSENSVSDDDYHRFLQRHDDHESAPEKHLMVVEGVRSGLIDVSKPLSNEEYEEQMAY